MKNIIRLVLLLALLALGWWLWTFLFPGPEKVIRQRMVKLAETVTLSTQDSPIARAAKAQKLVGLFSPDAIIVLDAPEFGSRSLTGRDEISETAMAGFSAIRKLRVRFLDVTVELTAGKQSAIVSCTAEVHFEDNKDNGVQEMRFDFKKIDGNWLIGRVETVKTLL